MLRPKEPSENNAYVLVLLVTKGFQFKHRTQNNVRLVIISMELANGEEVHIHGVYPNEGRGSVTCAGEHSKGKGRWAHKHSHFLKCSP
jgi:hypothetical protein